MTQITVSAGKREDIEQKIDALLADGKPYKTLKLVLPVSGRATRFKYRGMHVRQWRLNGNVRFDAAVEI